MGSPFPQQWLSGAVVVVRRLLWTKWLRWKSGGEGVKRGRRRGERRRKERGRGEEKGDPMEFLLKSKFSSREQGTHFDF